VSSVQHLLATCLLHGQSEEGGGVSLHEVGAQAHVAQAPGDLSHGVEALACESVEYRVGKVMGENESEEDGGKSVMWREEHKT
jgi:hypothetical protein